MIELGEARVSENGTLKGLPGDQTGKEVAVRTFRNDATENWTYVFRPLDQDLQERLANAMLQAALNPHIGYSQETSGDDLLKSRYGVYTEMIKTGCILAIDKDCNCDCSSLVAACCIISGCPVSQYMSTMNEEALLDSTKRFKKIQYIPGMVLYAGDIVFRIGHTGIITNSEYVRLWRKYVAKCVGYTKVYKDTEKKTYLPEWPLLGPGNLVDVTEEKDKLLKVTIAGKYTGYVDKEAMEKV